MRIRTLGRPGAARTDATRRGLRRRAPPASPTTCSRRCTPRRALASPRTRSGSRLACFVFDDHDGHTGFVANPTLSEPRASRPTARGACRSPARTTRRRERMHVRLRGQDVDGRTARPAGRGAARADLPARDRSPERHALHRPARRRRTSRRDAAAPRAGAHSAPRTRPRDASCGSPSSATIAWSVPALEALAGSAHEVVAVVTAAPKPAGRGNELTATPVADAAGAARAAARRGRDGEDRPGVQGARHVQPRRAGGRRLRRAAAAQRAPRAQRRAGQPPLLAAARSCAERARCRRRCCSGSSAPGSRRS